jgi:DNA-binding transcriptional regulator YhcF (GntR family)
MNTTLPPTDAPASAEFLAATAAFSPLYQQIKGLILQSLQAGEWKPGESIPSEMELAVRYRVSQGTVRKAIDELASGHLLIRKQGKGTFVATHAEHQVQYRFLKLVPDQGDSEHRRPRPARDRRLQTLARLGRDRPRIGFALWRQRAASAQSSFVCQSAHHLGRLVVAGHPF